jgi:hypothetical protein
LLIISYLINALLILTILFPDLNPCALSLILFLSLHVNYTWVSLCSTLTAIRNLFQLVQNYLTTFGTSRNRDFQRQYVCLHIQRYFFLSPDYWKNSYLIPFVWGRSLNKHWKLLKFSCKLCMWPLIMWFILLRFN